MITSLSSRRRNLFYFIYFPRVAAAGPRDGRIVPRRDSFGGQHTIRDRILGAGTVPRAPLGCGVRTASTISEGVCACVSLQFPHFLRPWPSVYDSVCVTSHAVKALGHPVHEYAVWATSGERKKICTVLNRFS